MMHLPMTLMLILLYLDPLHGAWELQVKKNTMVVDVAENPSVNVKCHTQDHQTVHWKKKTRKQRSNNGILNLTVQEHADAGNFTCHSDTGLILDYKVILLHEENLPQRKRILSKSGELLKCSVKNYSGNFSCFWNSTDDSNIEFFFKARRGDNDSISCDEPVKNKGQYSVECRDTQSCIYEEEEQSITVHLHVIQQHKYENYTLAFMLREITKPDPPQELNINNTKDRKHVSIHWKYPKTWCNRHSFFPLIFNVQIKKDEKTIEHQTDHTTFKLEDKHIESFCVQAKDKFFNSSWSEWSCYKLKNKSKKNEKKKGEKHKGIKEKKKKKKKTDKKL
ncbi:interleukin-12 subunit beta isoform X1 [Aquarana catesbeiana]